MYVCMYVCMYVIECNLPKFSGARGGGGARD